MTRKRRPSSAPSKSFHAKVSLDLVEVERLASEPEGWLAYFKEHSTEILDRLDTLPWTGLTVEQVLQRFADFRDLHRNVPSKETAALLAMLAMGRRQLAEGKTVSLESAIEYAKNADSEVDIQMPTLDEVEEAKPGRLTKEEFARMLAGGTRKGAGHRR